MLTDECELRRSLEKRGIEIIETRTWAAQPQLDDEPPSTSCVPAVHKLRGDVAAVFGRTIGPTREYDVTTWPRASASTPPYYLRAHAGMTGANFAVGRDRQLRCLHQRGTRT